MTKNSPLVSSPEVEAWARARSAKLLGCEQDEDAFIAQPELVPTIAHLLADSKTVASKRGTLVSALVLMIEAHLEDEADTLPPNVLDSILSILRANEGAAREAFPQLGLPGLVILQTLFGDPLAEDVPGWIRERYGRRLTSR